MVYKYFKNNQEFMNYLNFLVIDFKTRYFIVLLKIHY